MRLQTPRYRWFLFLALVFLFIPACSVLRSINKDSSLENSPNISTIVIPNNTNFSCDEIFELTFQHNVDYPDKFFDVSIHAVFISPEENTLSLNGFYYADDLWKIRFLPKIPGNWEYRYKFSSVNGYIKEGSGSFVCSPSDFKGRISQNPTNPFRWVYANGETFFPLGLQACIGNNGSKLGKAKIDGESRYDNSARIISMDEYFSIYRQAGFNQFRFSPNNCSYFQFIEPDQISVDESLATDELLKLANEYDFHVMFGLFGFYNRNGLINLNLLAKEKRYIEYCVARWGVYVDFWEILNESEVSNLWIMTVAEYLRFIDLEDRPISTSWERPRLPFIDINSPHWYETEDESSSDLRVHQQAEIWKQYNRPVIVGEQGNSGMNWDPTSGLRMRIRAWTALFEEISFIFWNTSYAKDGMHFGVYSPGKASNIYLGPEEREYIRILSQFSTYLDANVNMVSIKVSSPEEVRAYGLASDRVAAIYLHHYSKKSPELNGLNVEIDLPADVYPNGEWTGQWIDPSTGTIIEHLTLNSGINSIESPSFKDDIAFIGKLN